VFDAFVSCAVATHRSYRFFRLLDALPGGHLSAGATPFVDMTPFSAGNLKICLMANGDMRATGFAQFGGLFAEARE
jgi:hypothetical protein